jgi:hypothetical protein
MTIRIMVQDGDGYVNAGTMSDDGGKLVTVPSSEKWKSLLERVSTRPIGSAQSTDPEFVEAALRYYQGQALWAEEVKP